MKTWVLLVAAALVLSCTSRPQTPQSDQRDPPRQEAAQGEGPEPETDQEAVEVAENRAAVEPPTGPGQASFVVTEEVYNQTFDEIEEFIRNLNEIIRERDYQSWLRYLSDEYIQRTSDQDYLREQSEKPLLKKNNVQLESLRDYFEYVVAPSRSRASIEDIEFIDENQVKVISSIRGTRGILYLLVREDGIWKIGVWD